MTARNYSNTGSEAEISVLINSSDTTASLSNFSGFPSAPFIAAIDPDTSDEEIVLVTNVASSVVTITRAYDGTTAKTHAAGAKFRHVGAAIDFREANTHVNATSAVHGVSGSLVGTTDTQTLSNKTLTTPTISSPTITGTITAAGAAFSGSVTLSGTTITTLSVSGNSTLAGTLGVTGTATLGTTNTGALSATTIAASGAVTLSSTLGVTGALSGTSGAFSGALTALSATVTTVIPTEIEMVQNASDLTAAASRSSLYAKTDGGLYFTPNGGTKRRAAMQWPSDNGFPSNAIVGDMIYHTDLGAQCRYNGSNWVSMDGPVVIANMAARPTSSDLYAGFQVFSLAADDVYTYDGTHWRNGGTHGHTPSGASTGDYITFRAGSNVASLNGSGAISITHGSTFTAAPQFCLASPGAAGGGLRTVVPENTEFTTTAIKIYCYNSAGNLIAGTGSVRVNWEVIGYNT